MEVAVAAVEQWAKGGGISVAKETNRYIDDTLENVSVKDKEKLEEIEKMGVRIINGLEELKGVLE